MTGIGHRVNMGIASNPPLGIHFLGELQSAFGMLAPTNGDLSGGG